MILSVFCTLCLLVGSTRAASGWSYSGSTGPAFWKDVSATCDAQRQSPINLYEGDAVQNPFTPFTFTNYDATSGFNATLKNNGYGVKVDYSGATELTMQGGGFTDTFKVAQFHFHWGRTSVQGSEHLISSQAFPMELHIVHYNSKYSDLGEALKHADGVAVLGFMYEVSASDNANYADLVNNLSNVQSQGSKIDLAGFALNTLLQNSFSNFFRYDGSLTTPDCQEVVTWTVFKDSIKISESQMEKFRNVMDGNGNAIVDNFRPPMPLNQRVVQSSFTTGITWGYASNVANAGSASKWSEYYGHCVDDAGSKQSPIDIDPTTVYLDKSINTFTMSGYDSAQGVNMQLKNNGHTVQVDITAGDIRMSGGGLPGEFKAAQFHFHWGSDSTKGSEHLIDSAAYPMEVHIVHHHIQYPTLTDAVAQSDGLAVLGTMFEISKEDNPALDPIISKLTDISDPKTSTSMDTVRLDTFLPADITEFYRYSGSLTTPGCYESVTWTVFRKSIPISEAQLAKFRALLSADKNAAGTYTKMVNNYRPTMNRNNRRIVATFLIGYGERVTYSAVSLTFCMLLAAVQRLM
ncbi:carbonic anhydrase [Aplysia californica]|uniref:Carbonic anhydrase n=1 Tax=Aplysia californica TaxID=6500 RepID=A0ABM1VQ28_APLCA|nr:carbonic anhydrase [Aplysia californica]